MKIYCDKCHEDITAECNKNIENYKVGKVICPKCHYEQKRYISEADILLFFGLSEVSYIIFSLLSVLIFSKMGVNIYSILISISLLVLSYFISKQFSSGIYEKAYFKQDLKYKTFDEDEKAIQRNLNWQFLLFFAITITFITMDEGKIFFGIAMPLAAALSFLKFYLQLQNERKAK